MSASVLIPSTPNKNNREKSNKPTKRTKWVPLNEFINDDKIEDNEPSSNPPTRSNYYESRKIYREQRTKKNYKNQSAVKSSPLKSKNESSIKHDVNVAIQNVDNEIDIPDYCYESPDYGLGSPVFPFSPPTMGASQAYSTNYFDSYFQLPYASLSFKSPPSADMKNPSKTSDGKLEKTKDTKSKTLKKVVSDANIKYSSMEFNNSLTSASYYQEYHFNPNFLFESPISPVISPMSPMAAVTPLVLNLSPRGIDPTPPTSAPRLNRFQRIKIQLEYYFSISNLCKDMYLRKLIDRSSGGIKLHELIKFKRLKTLTNTNLDLLISVIRKNQSDLNLELINDDTEVRIENWKQWVV